MNDFTETDVQRALQNCADEPVHIPGIIQPFGFLLAYDSQTQTVAYASDNAPETLNQPMHDILGHPIRDLIGAEIWHGVQNFLATRSAAERRAVIGTWHTKDGAEQHLVAAWQSDRFVVLEFEAQSGDALLNAQELQTQIALINDVQSASSVQDLLDLTTKQMRHLTGFSRVMVYRFDQDWNGEVVAESRSSGVEPYLGLNFPSHDIPSQARDIMKRLPLRMISDIDQDPVPITAASADLPPLDISLCELRGTSKVHLKYLKNMGSRATITLSVVLDGELWGIISFHHTRPRIVPARLRMILRSFVDVFCLKLGLLIERNFKALANDVDDLQSELQAIIQTDPGIKNLFEPLGERLSETFQACGFYIKSADGDYTFGTVPTDAVIAQIMAELPSDKSSPHFSDELPQTLPEDLRADLAPIAGVAAVFHTNDWMILIFRMEASQNVSWAGDPNKTIEFIDGNARLSPRGSFSTFLTEVRGRSKPWTGEDQILAKKLWPMLSAALNSEQKRLYMRDLNRQQELMIDELNHRVRNILALVQAVSTEAKKSQSSLDSYSIAIEARIRALAAAHTIGFGSSAKKVDLATIIIQEAKPYEDAPQDRVLVTGTKMAIAPEFAPIFALTIHELMTNATKYGALSNTDGKVEVTMELNGEDLDIFWRETGGPRVHTPNRQGFGTTLVKRAVAYELGGESSLDFEPEGVQARIRLPAPILQPSQEGSDLGTYRPDFTETDLHGRNLPMTLSHGIALVVEDNFMISEGIAQQLTELGFARVETVSSVDSALELLETHTPSFAILDVNLGQNTTSLPVAELLLERHVPLIFATGYGEVTTMGPQLSKQIVLTKPIDTLELSNAIARSADKLT